ncbi:Pfs domain protein, partial [Metarhizium majus ARSEF 297]
MPSQYGEHDPRHSITEGTSNSLGNPPNRDGFGDSLQTEPPRGRTALIDSLSAPRVDRFGDQGQDTGRGRAWPSRDESRDRGRRKSRDSMSRHSLPGGRGRTPPEDFRDRDRDKPLPYANRSRHESRVLHVSPSSTPPSYNEPPFGMPSSKRSGGFRSDVQGRERDDRPPGKGRAGVLYDSYYGDRYPGTRSQEAQWNRESRTRYPGVRFSLEADTIRRCALKGHERNHPSISQEPSARDRGVSPTFPYNDDSVMPYATEFEFKLKRPITTAAENGTLYTTQWEDIPLPQVLIKADRDALYNHATRAPSFESVVGSGKRTSSDFSHGGSSQDSRYWWAEPTEITVEPELEGEPATLEPTILSVSVRSGLGRRRRGGEGDQEFEQWRSLSSDEGSNSQGSSNGTRSNYSANSEQAEGVSFTGEFGYEDQFSDDADSIYTADPDVPLSEKNANIFWLADDLFNKAFTENPDEDGLDRIEKLLPQLLKTFAIKVGSGGPTQIYRDVMVFVRRHRSEITKAMRHRYNEENSLRSDVLGNNVARIDPGDLVRRWRLDTNTLEDLNTAPNEISEDISDYSYYEDLDEADPAADSLPELSVYKDFISKLPEYKYKRLLERIQGTLCSSSNDDTVSKSNVAIIWHSPFTCREGCDAGYLPLCSLGPCFTLGVTGIAESIAEIGEQLAWLGSALRSSPYQTGIAVVNAFVSGMWMSPANWGTRRSEFSCNINFNLDAVDGTSEIPNGQCWHDLFRNPVIVKGYPIPRRPLSNMGLEIRLDTMAHLAGTRHIQLFNNKIFIKGFSIMLVPTRHSDNIFFWHLLSKKNGDRISYLDSDGSHVEETNLYDLETSRHILGWSSSVRYLTGAADANYVIESSWLKCLPENCNLNGKVVTPGRLIKSDHAAALGKRDVSLQVSGDAYRKKLYALSNEYVVLWDVKCKRGWLVNGVNALLHLLRASLEFNKSDDCSFRFLFESDKFREAKNPYTVSAALEVLMNASNLDMELYEEDEKDESNASIKYRIRDRVNDLYGTLEKLIDYQRSITGERLKSSPRKDLEGWDFKDIATNNKIPSIRVSQS